MKKIGFFFSCYLDIRWRSFLACIDKTKGRKEKNWKVENFTFLFCCRCCFRVSNLPWKQYELQKLIFFYFCSNSFYLLILLISSTLNAVINLMTKNWNTKILLKSFTTQICPPKKKRKTKRSYLLRKKKVILLSLQSFFFNCYRFRTYFYQRGRAVKWVKQRGEKKANVKQQKKKNFFSFWFQLTIIFHFLLVFSR